MKNNSYIGLFKSTSRANNFTYHVRTKNHKDAMILLMAWALTHDHNIDLVQIDLYVESGVEKTWEVNGFELTEVKYIYKQDLINMFNNVDKDVQIGILLSAIEDVCEEIGVDRWYYIASFLGYDYDEEKKRFYFSQQSG